MENKYVAIKVEGVKKDLHRVLMENHLGRKLGFNEVVHHINGDKSDNSIENLKVMSRSEHTRMHMTGYSAKKSTIEKLRTIGIEKRPLAKLSVENVKEVRQMLSTGMSCGQISKKFNVDRTSIWQIKSGKTYSWIKE